MKRVLKGLYYSIYAGLRKMAWVNYYMQIILSKMEKSKIYQYVYWKRIVAQSKNSEKFPEVISFHVTHLCNANCMMCPIPSRKRKDILSFEAYEKIITQDTHGHTPKKVFFTGGETTFDKTLHQKIELTRKVWPETLIKIFTRGDRLNEKVSFDIIKAGLDDITISVDAADPNMYKNIRTNLDLKKILENAKIFNRLRRKINRKKRPMMRFNMICLEKNKESINDYINQMSKYVDIISITNAHNWGGHVNDKTMKGFYDTEEDIKIKKVFTQVKRWPCWLIMTHIPIYWTGDVPYRGTDIDMEYVMGNALEKSIYDIWNSPEYRELRSRHLNFDYDFGLCKRCNCHYNWWQEHAVKSFD